MILVILGITTASYSNEALTQGKNDERHLTFASANAKLDLVLMKLASIDNNSIASINGSITALETKLQSNLYQLPLVKLQKNAN